MIEETRNLEDLLTTLQAYLPITGLDPEEWLEDSSNICLTNNKGDFSLFEYQRQGTYSGHYFFKSRGKEALVVAKQMVEHLFTNTEAQTVSGLTPLEHLGARWLSRKLGFKSYGVLGTTEGPCEFFILFKRDWEQTLNE